MQVPMHGHPATDMTGHHLAIVTLIACPLVALLLWLPYAISCGVCQVVRPLLLHNI